MHMGAAAVLAAQEPKNLRHVVINNEAHDSVGAQPTIMKSVEMGALVKAVGYKRVYEARSEEEIRAVWKEYSEGEGPSLLEIKVKCGSRKDLGRPKERPAENKAAFMKFLQD